MLLKTVTATILAMSFSLGGYASESDVSNWTPFQYPISDFNENITGWVTNGGDTRLSLSDSMSASAILRVPKIPRDRADIFQQDCEFASDSPNFYKVEFKPRESFLDVRVFPFSKLDQQKMISDLRAEIPRITNGIAKNTPTPYRFNVILKIDPDSILARSDLKLDFLQNRLAEQLKSQIPTIVNTGTASLEFTGFSDLTCDLNSHKAKLFIATQMIFAEPKPQVTSFVTSDELSSIYHQVKANYKRLPSTMASIFLAGRIFQQTSSKSWPSINSVSDEKVAKVFSQFFSPENGMLRDLNNDDFKVIAQSLDDVSTVGSYSKQQTIEQVVKLSLGSY